MNNLIRSALLLSFASNALADGVVTATIDSVVIKYRADKAKIRFTSNIEGEHGNCRNGGNKNTFAVDLTKASADYVIAVALAAKASGAQVKAWGDGTCSIFPAEAETLKDITIL